MDHYVELQFEQRGDQAWVRINESPLGQCHGAFQAPFTPDQAAGRLEFAGTSARHRADQAALGGDLYRALERPGVAQALSMAVNQARATRAQVILQLRFDKDAVSLAALPWELLHDSQRHLLAAGAVDLTRYITYGEGLAPLQAERPLRVLHLAASPQDQIALNLAASAEALANVAGLVVERCPAPTYDALLARLERQPSVHILHFDGHGRMIDGRPVLCFEDGDSYTDEVDADALGHALYNRLSLVVLNACQSAQVETRMISLFEGMAPALIQAGIPAVVGMQYPVLDRSAARFIPAFYGAVSRGEPLTRAMTAARRWLYREGSWYIPTLYLRSGDPDGHLFPAEWPPSQEPVTAPPSEGEQSLPLVERQSLERQLAIHRGNLRTLREQAALFGTGTTPLHLVNEIALQEQAIQDIERRLGH